jgi:uncharacterized protein
MSGGSRGRDGEQDTLLRLLRESETIAVVGASPDPFRASHYVMAYLQARGYRCLPVNPRAAGTTINGERVAARLADLAAPVHLVPVHLVNVFRNSAAAAESVDEAILLKDVLRIRGIWLQLGVVNEPAAQRARAAGLLVVQDRCIKIEYARLLGSAPRASIAGTASAHS